MIKRLLDRVAPVRAKRSPDTGYRRLLGWAALPVTNRRWAAPLSAVALGFGLFAGVAIGPGAAGSLAVAPYQVIELPSFGGGAGEGGEAEEESPLAAAPESGESFGGEEEPSAGFVPVAPVEEEPAPGEEPLEKEPAPQKEAKSTQPEKQELTGVVVHVNPAASSYTVAETGGTMSAVHTGKLPPAGARIEVPIRALANGTLAEAGKRKKTGMKTRATLAGIVTFVDADPVAPSYAVSNKGTSALVEVHPDPSGAVPPLPVLGAYASVTVEIEPAQPAASTSAAPEGVTTEPAPVPQLPAEPAPAPPPAATAPPTCAPDPSLPPVTPKAVLWQQQLNSGGAPYTSASFEGIVEAVCPATGQLLVSADDIREAGHDLLFSVPAGIDAGKLAVGSSILANADIAADGSLALTGLASDERLKGADDEKATQGDLVPEKPKGQDQG